MVLGPQGQPRRPRKDRSRPPCSRAAAGAAGAGAGTPAEQGEPRNRSRRRSAAAAVAARSGTGLRWGVSTPASLVRQNQSNIIIFLQTAEAPRTVRDRWRSAVRGVGRVLSVDRLLPIVGRRPTPWRRWRPRRWWWASVHPCVHVCVCVEACVYGSFQVHDRIGWTAGASAVAVGYPQRTRSDAQEKKRLPRARGTGRPYEMNGQHPTLWGRPCWIDRDRASPWSPQAGRSNHHPTSHARGASPSPRLADANGEQAASSKSATY